MCDIATAMMKGLQLQSEAVLVRLVGKALQFE